MSRQQGKKREWRDLTPTQRRAIVGAGAVQLSLMVAALRDLRRRPAEQIRGSKRIWFGASFVNFIGPLAYFAVGRKG